MRLSFFKSKTDTSIQRLNDEAGKSKGQLDRLQLFLKLFEKNIPTTAWQRLEPTALYELAITSQSDIPSKTRETTLSAITALQGKGAFSFVEVTPERPSCLEEMFREPEPANSQKRFHDTLGRIEALLSAETSFSTEKLQQVGRELLELDFELKHLEFQRALDFKNIPAQEQIQDKICAAVRPVFEATPYAFSPVLRPKSPAWQRVTLLVANKVAPTLDSPTSSRPSSYLFLLPKRTADAFGIPSMSKIEAQEREVLKKMEGTPSVYLVSLLAFYDKNKDWPDYSSLSCDHFIKAIQGALELKDPLLTEKLRLVLNDLYQKNMLSFEGQSHLEKDVKDALKQSGGKRNGKVFIEGSVLEELLSDPEAARSKLDITANELAKLIEDLDGLFSLNETQKIPTQLHKIGAKLLSFDTLYAFLEAMKERTDDDFFLSTYLVGKLVSSLDERKESLSIIPRESSSKEVGRVLALIPPTPPETPIF